MMAKFWVPGEVKTRLGSSIGMAPAASIHRLFTTHLCKNLCRSAERRELCIAPDGRIAEVESTLAETKLDRHWRVVRQGEGDLGQRMAQWMTRNLILPDSRSILIGADCPTLGDHDIRQAIDLLDRHDVVLGPALDGGYYLIGLRGCWDDRRSSLFQSIPWSEPDVLERTTERVAIAGLSLARLPAAQDIDTILELNQLTDRLRKSTSPPDRDLLSEIQRALEPSSPHPEPPHPESQSNR
jgi:rSAM/selenodomain-associated transferase 1